MHLDHNKSDKNDSKRIYDYGVQRTHDVTQMTDKYCFSCRLLNNTIHDMTKETTRLSNQLQTLKRCPFDSRSVKKCQERLLKKLRE